MAIRSVEDRGSIVQILLDNGQSIIFDHRMFWMMAENENYELIGREIEVNNESIKFL